MTDKMTTGRFIGVDVGTRRVGLAVSNDGNTMALPHSTVSPSEAVEAILEVARDIEAEGIVVGWPLEMSGAEGPAVERVKRFLKKFEEELGSSELDLRVETWDERLTTTAAEAKLVAADVSRRKRKEVIDQVAAAHILEAFLDAERNDERDGER